MPDRSHDKHRPIGKPKHAGEQRGIDLIVRSLPDDYIIYSNVELSTGRRSGQTYEHDVLVLAPHAVFTVELKSWGGRISGNRDRWQREDGSIVQSPIPLTLEKARVLKGVLEARARALRDVWVQGLVLLTEVDAQPSITPDFAHFVATHKDIQRLLTDPAAWGLSGRLTERQREDVLRVFADGTPASIPSTLAHFELLQRLPAEDRPYRAWLGKGSLLRDEQRVLHAYEIRGDSQKARQRVREQALREATLHERLKGGPDLLGYHSYFTLADPDTVVLIFDDTTALLPAGTWIDKHNPGLDDRLRVARRAAAALAWMHQRDIVHRRLSLQAVLVSPAPSPADVRLSALDLARDLTGVAPTVTSSLLEDPSYRCMAPELVRGGDATVAGDLFALGASLVELFNGRPLFERMEDALRPFEVPPLHVAGQPVPGEVAALVDALLAPAPADRPASAADVVAALDRALTRPERPAPRPDRDVLRQGQRIDDVYELIQHLGEGASGSTWKATHTLAEVTVVLKIGDAAQAELFRNEADALKDIQHENLVRFRDLRPYAGGNVLVLAFAEGVDGRTWAGAGDPLTQSQLLYLASGLFGALGALHDRGWLHRDVKPENIILREQDARPVLIDLGLARHDGEEGELTVGTVAYKDPLLWIENRWTPANDLFAAWLVLYEILTGVHPFNHRPEGGRQPSIDRDLFPDAFDRPTAERLALLFEAALAPDRAARPATAADALARLRDVLAGPPTSAARAQSLPLPLIEPRTLALPGDVEPRSPLERLDLSIRAQRALSALGVALVGQIAAIPDASLKGLRNVGRKTRAELQVLRQLVRARFPDLAAAPAPVAGSAPDRFYPALADDPRLLSELGTRLPDAARDKLIAQGVVTVGGLAALPVPLVRGLPRVGATKLSELHRAMQKLAGDAARPSALRELAEAIREELGAEYRILNLLLGLETGAALSPIEAAERLGVTRQRISQAKDLERLRAGASAGAWLMTLLEDVLPRAGFAPLEDAAAALAARLPAGELAHPLGYARLGALLLIPGRRVNDIEHLDFVLRPPWTVEAVAAIRARLSDAAMREAAAWEPLPRAEAEALLWDALTPELQGALRRWGADAAALLRATLPLCPGIARTPDEALFTPPVSFAAALKHYRTRLTPGMGVEDLQGALRREVPGVEDPADLRAALASVGFALRGGLVVEAGKELEPAPVVPQLDPDVPRLRVAPEGPVEVRGLLAALEPGGFRVVGLTPGKHHQLCERLAGSLREALGDERVRFVDVDRTLIEVLQAGGLWEDAVFEEGRATPQWGWAKRTLEEGLEEAVLGRTGGEVLAARPGVVTVLGRPSLLGPLGMMAWLSGFYERARGGKVGLVVLALPSNELRGGRVRLNDQYSFPYTPDMAAVWLDEAQG